MATKKTAQETAAPKAAAAKKAASADVKETVYVEYAGGQIDVKNIIADVKAAYSAEGGSEPISSVDVYIKPEEKAAYYVINGNSEGKKVDLYF